MIEQQGQELAAKLREEEARREAEMRQYEAEERQRRERGSAQQRRNYLPPGTLEDRKVTFSDGRGIIVGDSGVPCDTWIAYGAGRRDGLWMLYDVEGVVAGSNGDYGNEHGITALKRKIPVCSLQVIDFAAPYYTTAPGKKRIDAMFSDLENLVSVRHPNLAAIYAVKVRILYGNRSAHGAHIFLISWQREAVPGKWPRIYVLTERFPEGGKLRSWLAAVGCLSEDVTKVGVIDFVRSSLMTSC